jgi:hypothetical protein
VKTSLRLTAFILFAFGCFYNDSHINKSYAEINCCSPNSCGTETIRKCQTLRGVPIKNCDDCPTTVAFPASVLETSHGISAKMREGKRHLAVPAKKNRGNRGGRLQQRKRIQEKRKPSHPRRLFTIRKIV